MNNYFVLSSVVPNNLMGFDSVAYSLIVLRFDLCRSPEINSSFVKHGFVRQRMDLCY